MYYAVLNDLDICVGISHLSGEVFYDNHIIIPDMSEDYIYRRYNRDVEQWSEEKYHPVATAPIDEFEKLKADQALMQQALDELILGGAL